MRFAKYTGAGNDFVIAVADWNDAKASRVARRVCPRSTGVGVDGLIVLRRLGPDRVRATFVNPDGSVFSTCGNGSRCAARFAVDQGLVESSRLTLVTGAADILASVEGDSVELIYRIGIALKGSFAVEGPRGSARGWLVHIGLPHFVLPVEKQPDGPIEPLCRPIRHLEALGSDGANVNLVELHDRVSGSIRTFERGVEAETLACGSGAMASTFALHAAGLCERSVRLRTRGGDHLQITLADEAPGPDGLRELRLAGPVAHLFDGSFPAEART